MDNKGGIDQQGVRVDLTGVWDRMGDVCKKLWSEDRVSAVSLQALLEEFKGEVERAQQTLVTYQRTLQETRKTISLEITAEYKNQLSLLQTQLAAAREDAASVSKALQAEKDHSSQLAAALETQEAKNLEFKDRFLKTEMERDVVRGRKMEEFYQEVLVKSKDLESSWEQKHRELETKYLTQEEDLRKKNVEHLEGVRKLALDLERTYSQKEAELGASYERLRGEMESRESKCLKLEEDLRSREEGLNARRRELDDLKLKLQQEISAVVRGYQEKPKGP